MIKIRLQDGAISYVGLMHALYLFLLILSVPHFGALRMIVDLL